MGRLNKGDWGAAGGGGRAVHFNMRARKLQILEEDQFDDCSSNLSVYVTFLVLHVTLANLMLHLHNMLLYTIDRNIEYINR